MGEANNSQEGEDGGGGDEGDAAPSPGDLHQSWQDELALVKRLRLQGLPHDHPAMQAACRARDDAEKDWRDAEDPTPPSVRLARAQAKLDRAIALQADTRQAILDCEKAHRERMEVLQSNMDEDQERVRARRSQLEQVQEEVGTEGGGKARAEQGEAVKQVHGTICNVVAPTIAALIEQLDSATPAWCVLNGLLGSLSSSKALLEKQSPKTRRRSPSASAITTATMAPRGKIGGTAPSGRKAMTSRAKEAGATRGTDSGGSTGRMVRWLTPRGAPHSRMTPPTTSAWAAATGGTPPKPSGTPTCGGKRAATASGRALIGQMHGSRNEPRAAPTQTRRRQRAGGWSPRRSKQSAQGPRWPHRKLPTTSSGASTMRKGSHRSSCRQSMRESNRSQPQERNSRYSTPANWTSGSQSTSPPPCMRSIATAHGGRRATGTDLQYGNRPPRTFLALLCTLMAVAAGATNAATGQGSTQRTACGATCVDVHTTGHNVADMPYHTGPQWEHGVCSRPIALVVGSMRTRPEPAASNHHPSLPPSRLIGTEAGGVAGAAGEEHWWWLHPGAKGLLHHQVRPHAQRCWSRGGRDVFTDCTWDCGMPFSSYGPEGPGKRYRVGAASDAGPREAALYACFNVEGAWPPHDRHAVGGSTLGCSGQLTFMGGGLTDSLGHAAMVTGLCCAHPRWATEAARSAVQRVRHDSRPGQGPLSRGRRRQRRRERR